MIQFDEFFPITVKASNEIKRTNYIKDKQGKYRKMDKQEYKEEEFVVEKQVDDFDVEEFVLVYENDSDEAVTVDASFKYNGECREGLT